MSLVSYADLQAQVANWLARSDLNTYIPDMITLFEAEAARRLRVSSMEVEAATTPSSGEASLPGDFLQMRRLTLLSSPYIELQYVSPQTYANGIIADSSLPQEYTIEANVIKLRPTGDDSSNLELLYYAKTSALSSALNWLYANHPDAYLFGTLAEANFFVRGDALQMAAAWMQRRNDIFDGIQLQEFRSKPVGMMIRVRGATP